MPGCHPQPSETELLKMKYKIQQLSEALHVTVMGREVESSNQNSKSEYSIRHCAPRARIPLSAHLEVNLQSHFYLGLLKADLTL